MNDQIIARRYQSTSNGRVAIDIAVASLNQLYNPFDSHAAASLRELDQNFVDYLTECAKEVDSRDYLIRIAIEQPLTTADIQQVGTSISNYFLYLAAVARRKLHASLKKTIVLLLAGLLLISSSGYWPATPVPPGTALRIIQEGMVIVAWVSLWEAFASIIFQWYPMLRMIGFYREISRAELLIIGQPPAPQG